MEKSRLRPSSLFRSFLVSEVSGGLTLMFVAASALLIANSPLAPFYFDLLHRDLFGLSVLHWINDALMAVFFLFVGLEIKREFLDGHLASWRRRVLPGIAALGGMVVPALIFIAVNWDVSANLRGWAIPSATDIAFALGVLALLGRRVPVSLKIFLTALAILDDLGAVLIIALFYTAELSPLMLGLAAVTLLGLVALNQSGVKHLAPYLVLGVVLWFFVLQSGIHATLAGVALAITIPLQTSTGDSPTSPLHRLEHTLYRWVAFLVVPLFGFANAGVSFAGLGPSALLDPVPLGITLGLFFGKQAGIFGFAWFAIRIKIAKMPRHASLAHLYGVAVLCGIGFTMSLFIGLLAYPESAVLQDKTKLGVLLGSTLAGIVGWLILRFTRPDVPEEVSPS